MIPSYNQFRGCLLRSLHPFPTLPTTARCLCSSSYSHDLTALLRDDGQTRRHSNSLSFSVVAALKSAASFPAPTFLSYGQQLHSLSLKSGLDLSNVFVRNGLINLYAKHRLLHFSRALFRNSPVLDSASWNTMLCALVKSSHLDEARHLFDQMPAPDCVSFTTIIMGLAQDGRSADALLLFRDMAAAGVAPTEVTLASVISACASLGEVSVGRAFHALAIRAGLEALLLVSTNLVHLYAACSCLLDSEAVFLHMTERNSVTWNVMLNGYCKLGVIDKARETFDRMPDKDLVSWSTMIDGYLKLDRLSDAILTYCEMLRTAEARPNEVMVVDLVSTCGRLSATHQGQQFHALISKSGLDYYPFVQATVVHFYSVCGEIEDARLQFELGDKGNVSSWNALLVGFSRSALLGSARMLFEEMPVRDIVSWSTMIASYARNGHPDLAVQLFQNMLGEGLQPNEITMVSVLSAVANCGTLEQGRWMHRYISERSILLNDNLSAAIIDMYSKCGSIDSSLQLFHQVRDKVASISPWNAVICGLAMHGKARMCLDLFTDLQRTSSIKPNSITFLGVLGACCHGGLLETGKSYFESMTSTYGIEPNIKHYGCMVDLLGRGGRLDEARELIGKMPMGADVVIWGAMLAASRAYGNVEIGELAAEKLSSLEPTHGAGRILLSNIYAGVGRWNDVLHVRKAMQGREMMKSPGCSGIA